MNKINYQNETWDGQAIECRVVNITVADQAEFKYYWARPYVGRMRQALEVKSQQSTFYIDNAGGSGIYKVAGGAHMWKGHRSLLPEPNTPILEVVETDIIYPTPQSLRDADERCNADAAALFGQEYVDQHARMLETLKDMKAGKIYQPKK